MINVFGDEEFKPVIRYGMEIPDYYIPRDGRGIYSSKSNKILSITIDKKSHNSINYQYSTLSLKPDFFGDYIYETQGDSNFSLKLRIHRAVMETWKPIDEYPPDQLSDTWWEVPEEWRQWVRDTALVDHKDDNPYNNHVDNLRWSIPKDNQTHRKNQKYGDKNEE